MCCIAPAGVQERRSAMATGALVIGFGPAVRGREQKALQVFNEAIQYYTQLQQQGVIESFEPVALEPHGGDLAGFLLIRADREKLNALRTNEEFLRLNTPPAQLLAALALIPPFLSAALHRHL